MLGTALEEYASYLRERTSAPVEIDAGDLTLPGVLVSPENITFEVLDGDRCTITVAVWIIGNGDATRHALNDIGNIGYDLRHETHEWQPTTLALSSQSADALPALQGTVEITYEKD
ncbi:hypothetical protein [Canibacter zhoujuaniae]|uniref:hypothetical protein n=1 Tax=Canibacter zhoujuaniae TaxID=2708343 RepID=UPI00141EBBC3|nr:hypothetical protein [Canibacter zhoujuaniae]